MQVIHRIHAIEKRAADLELTLAEVCRLARVPYATIWRWQTGRTSPLERTAKRHFERLEKALRQRAAAIRKGLGSLAA